MSVYALVDPRDGRSRYVGRSRNPFARLKRHCSPCASIAVRRWVAELNKAGLAPRVEVLGTTRTEKAWVRRLKPDLNVRLKAPAKTTQLQIRLSGDEKTALEEAAKRARMTVSAFVVALGAVTR